MHGQSISYNSLGVAYFFSAQYEMAIKNYEKSLSISSSTGDVNRAETLHTNIASSYLNSNLPRDEINRKALSHLKESVKLNESIGAKLIEEEQKIGFYGSGDRTYQLNSTSLHNKWTK